MTIETVKFLYLAPVLHLCGEQAIMVWVGMREIGSTGVPALFHRKGSVGSSAFSFPISFSFSLSPSVRLCVCLFCLFLSLALYLSLSVTVCWSLFGHSHDTHTHTHTHTQAQTHTCTHTFHYWLYYPGLCSLWLPLSL
jgi:hypothetical protein